jgi:hypothetical protein
MAHKIVMRSRCGPGLPRRAIAEFDSHRARPARVPDSIKDTVQAMTQYSAGLRDLESPVIDKGG